MENSVQKTFILQHNHNLNSPTIFPNRELKSTGDSLKDNHVQKFMNFCNENKLSIDIESFKQYIAFRKKNRAKVTTLNSIKNAVKTSIEKTYEQEIESSFELKEKIRKEFRSIKTGKVDKKVHKEEILTDEEISHLLNEIKSDKPYQIYNRDRLYHFIQFLNVSGLRVSEMINIRVDDCIINKDMVYININGKGSKERRIFIPISDFENITNTFNGKVYLFETSKTTQYNRHNLWKFINNASLQILGKPFKCHGFRHTFATRLIVQKKIDIKSVSQYLGHESTSTTADMYVHNELEPKDLFST